MTIRALLVPALGAALAVAGCGGRPTGNLQALGETADIPGASKVEILAATTRSDVGAKPGEFFTGERGDGLAFADFRVSIPPDADRAVGSVQWPDHPPGDPRKEFVTLQSSRATLDQARARLDARLAKTGGRVLVFVHGFNTRFEEAVYRLAQITHDSGVTATPVLFTWPSRGKLLAYAYDRESANYSRDALEQMLHGLARDPKVKEISILAHSMGNWVAVETLRQMAIRDKVMEPKIKSVILAAPDLDVDVFRKQIAQLPTKRPPFALFTSRDDEALAVSSKVWGNIPRLGSIDPKAAPYMAELKQENIQAYDLTDVKSADALNHGTFAENPEIIRALGKRLFAGQSLNDVKVGVGEQLGNVVAGVATSAGHAATMAISAPLAIVDPASRESLEEHADALGQSLGDTLPHPTR